VSQFKENRLTQYFIQGGKRIDIPASTWDGVPQDSSNITPEFCTAQFKAFGDRDRFAEVGGFEQLNTALRVPMVLVMSIWDDVSCTVFTLAHYDTHISF
jgi:cellulose 1,4-beta-cellobiosidase